MNNVCPNCGANLDLNPGGICEECGLDLSTGRKFALNINPLSVKLPYGSSIVEERGDLLVTLTGRGHIHSRWFFIPVVIAIYCIIYGLNLQGSQAASLQFVLAFIVFLCVAIPAGYWYYQRLYRQAVMKISDSALEISDTGRPSFYISASEIIQLYCREEKKILKDYRDKWGKEHFYTLHTFSLIACLKNGSRKELLQDIESAVAAQFLEEKIEEKLRILDRPVDGEYDIAKKIEMMNKKTPPPSGGFNMPEVPDVTELPGFLTVASTYDSFTVKRKWFNWDEFTAGKSEAIYMWGLPAILSFIFLISGFLALTTDGGHKLGSGYTGLMILSGMVLLIIGYIAAAALINHTTVEISDKYLKVSHGPIYLPLGFTIDRHSIQDLYIDERALGKERIPKYDIAVALNGRTKATLIKSAGNLKQAQMLIYKLKNYLNIYS